MHHIARRTRAAATATDQAYLDHFITCGISARGQGRKDCRCGNARAKGGSAVQLGLLVHHQSPVGVVGKRTKTNQPKSPSQKIKSKETFSQVAIVEPKTDSGSSA
jgi:hypothetical protein